MITPGYRTQSLPHPLPMTGVAPHPGKGGERGRGEGLPSHGYSPTHPSPVLYPHSQGPPSPSHASLALGCHAPRLEFLQVSQRCPPGCLPTTPYPITSSPCPILTPLPLGPPNGSPQPSECGPLPLQLETPASLAVPGSPVPMWTQPPAHRLCFVWSWVPGPVLPSPPATSAGSVIWNAVLC